MKSLKRNYKDLNRLQSIIYTLVKYGFGDVIAKLRIDLFHRAGKYIIPDIEKKDILRKTLPERLRLAFEELGPTFIKLGQMLSVRPDIIPKNVSDEFSKLQDEVPPISTAAVKEIINSEFKEPVNKLFKSFSEGPVAAASIAQVHSAVTWDNHKVAVKVQRPDIESIIETDLDILLKLATLAEKHIPSAKLYQPTRIVRDFSKNLQYELDFYHEGRNIDLFYNHFKEDETIYIPKVYWDLSSKKVLVMEYISGIKASDLEKIDSAELDRKTIANNGAKWILKQVFEYGFFHADPHPGNLFVLEGNKIAPIDFGMVGYIDNRMKEELSDALIAFTKRDTDKIIKILFNMQILDDLSDVSSLQHDLNDLVNYYYNIKLSQLDVGKVLMEIVGIIQNHHLTVPSDFVLMTKSLTSVEGLGKLLDPDFEFISIAKPYVKKIFLKRFAPNKEIRDLFDTVNDYRYLFKNIPFDLGYVLRKIKSGKFNIQFEHRGLDKLISELDRSSSRLSFSIIIAALLLASSLIIQLNKGPMFFGLPAIGLIGYSAAGILGVWLLIAILRSGKL